MVLISLVSMADMIQVGRVGPSAITSVGLTNQPIMLLQAIFQALNVGTTALVARFTGMGQPDKASDTLRQTFVVTILLGLIISLFAGVAAPYILQFIGAEQDVITIGTPYFRVVASGFVFNAAAMAIGSALRRRALRKHLPSNGPCYRPLHGWNLPVLREVHSHALYR